MVVADAGAGAVDHLAVGRAQTCLVVGAEAGLTDDLLGALGALRATRVRIDVDSSVESLNAAVAGSYLLLDARRRRRDSALSSSRFAAGSWSANLSWRPLGLPARARAPGKTHC